MFILAIEFIGNSQQAVSSTKQVVFKTEKKATMLRYKSPLIQTISSILYSPFIVYGLTEETQRISREVVSVYEEKPVSIIHASDQLFIFHL